uniref:Uncharacterized protein n=1 Tax=Molossus molossus TaxID=27622 RepID=A0A7J8CRM2_MOLMO|nr:hypothetical protein HJG59_009767 [Molossus molossus]
MTKHSWLLAIISAHLRYVGPRASLLQRGLSGGQSGCTRVCCACSEGGGGRVFEPLFPEALLNGPGQRAVSRVHWTLRWAKPGAAEASDPGLRVDKLPAACTPDTAPQAAPSGRGVDFQPKSPPRRLSPGPLHRFIF